MSIKMCHIFFNGFSFITESEVDVFEHEVVELEI